MHSTRQNVRKIPCSQLEHAARYNTLLEIRQHLSVDAMSTKQLVKIHESIWCSYVCPSLCVFLSLSACGCICVCICPSLSFSGSVSMCVCVCLFLSVSLYVSVAVALYLSVFLSPGH